MRLFIIGSFHKTKNSYYFRPTLADNGEIGEEMVGVISSGNPERLKANSIAVYKISELLRLCQRIFLRSRNNNCRHRSVCTNFETLYAKICQVKIIPHNSCSEERIIEKISFECINNFYCPDFGLDFFFHSL